MKQDNQTQSTDSQVFVPFTARLMAAMRAKETARPDALFNDTFADRLAGPEAYKLLEERLTPDDVAYLAVRTRYLDDFVLSACSLIKQLVILGAGMDTRAFRLPLASDTHIYELDQAEVLDYKNTLLQEDAPRCQRYTIAADLSLPWTQLLIDRGFNPHLPSVWLVEGLLMYLEPAAVDRLLSDISALAIAGSQLALDAINTPAINYEPYQGYFKSGIDDPETYLAAYGWQAIVRQPGEAETRFNRITEAPPSRELADVGRVFLVKATRG